MIRILLLSLFFFGIFFLPWFIVVGVAILLLAYTRDSIPVLAGGLVYDVLYGAPIALFWGYAYLYTTLFLLLIAVSILLRKQLLH